MHQRHARAVSQESAAPSMKRLAAFSVPLLAIGLSSPMLSLVDTAVVGRHAGPIPLAALAPATAYVDIAAYAATFLAPTTTNFVASALARGDVRRERREVQNALVFASALGVLTTVVMLALCRPCLRLLSGTGDAGGLLLAEACIYSRWRALGMPAAHVFMVLQATFLGGKSWLPPTLAMLVAAIFNLVFDLWLVAGAGMGCAGAAIATVVAQYGAAATLAFMRWRRVADADATNAVATTAAAEQPGDGGAAAASAPPAAPPGPLPTSGLPTRSELSAWARFGLPLAVGQAARCVTFAQMTAAATACGAVAAAAQQVCVRLFYISLPFGDAVSTTAQTFLPAVNEGCDADDQRRTRVRVAKLGLLTGLLTCALVSAPLVLPALTSTFTSDPAIRSAIVKLLPFVGACSLVYSVASAAEGILVAVRDLRPIALLYASWPALIGGALVAYRPWLGASAVGGGVPLLAWAAFTTVHVARLVTFVARALRVHRRSSPGKPAHD